MSIAPVASIITDNLSLPNEQFYELCSQLNEGQEHFIMQHSLHYKLAEKNNKLPSKPFQIFLRGGAGVGKSFLIKAITEYLKRFLRYPNQNLSSTICCCECVLEKLLHVSMLLHCILHFSVKSALKSLEYKNPSDETLHMLRNK